MTFYFLFMVNEEQLLIHLGLQGRIYKDSDKLSICFTKHQTPVLGQSLPNEGFLPPRVLKITGTACPSN